MGASDIPLLGLDPTQGIGKAIDTIWDGQPQDLAEFAKAEFGYEPDTTNPLGPMILDGLARLDAVGQSAGSVAVPTQADVLALAEESGDYQKTMQMKAYEVAGWFGGRR